MNLGQLIITLGVDTKQLYEAEVKVRTMAVSMQDAADKAATRIQTAGRHMINFYSYGYRATRMLTVPLIAFGTVATKTFKDFEFSMAKITGLVGIAEEKTKQWGDVLLQMGPQVAKTPKELGEGLYFVASAGFKSAKALDIVELAAKGASAGLGKTSDVANVLTSALNAYRGSGLTAKKAMDQLIAAVREGKAYPEQFATSLGKVLPIAAELGVSFDQVTGAMAAMTLQGASAANASTYLAGVLRAMLDPSEQSKTALEDLGTSMEEMKNLLAKRGLIAALMKINQLQVEYGDDLVSRVFPRVRAITGVLSLMGKNYEYNYQVMQKVRDAQGDLERALKAASTTFEFQWNAAMSLASVSLIKFGKVIGKEIIPLIRDLANIVNRLADWFSALDDSTKKLIVRIGLLTAASGPLYLVLGFLTNNILPNLIRLFKWALIPVLSFVGRSFVSVGITVSGILGPIGALVVAVGALVGTYSLFKKRGEEVVSTQKEINETMEDASKIAEERTKQVRSFLKDLGLIKEVPIDVALNISTSDINKQVNKFTQVWSRAAGKTNVKVLPVMEQLDTSERAIKRMHELIAKLPLTTLRSMREVIGEEIIEIRRQLKQLGTPPRSDLVKFMQVDKLKTKLDALLAIWKEIGGEIERMPSIEDHAGVDPVFLRTTKELEREMKVIDVRAQLLGGRFDDVTAKTSAWEKVLDILTDRFAKSKKEIPGLREEIDRLLNSLDTVEITKFNQDIDAATLKSILLGKSFNIYNEILQIHKNRLDELIKRYENAKRKLGETNAETIKLRTEMGTLSEKIKEYTAAAASEEMQRQVEYSKALSDSLGTWSAKQDLLNAQIQKTSTGLYQLFLAEKVNTKGWDDLIIKLDQATRKLQKFSDETSVKFLKALAESTGNFSIQMEVVQAEIQKVNNELRDIASHGGVGSDAWKEGVKQLREYSLALSELETKQQILTTLKDSVVNFVTEIGTAIGKALTGTEYAWTNFVDIILRTAQQILKIMLGVAIMAKLLWGAMIPGGLVFGLIGVSALLAAWESYKSSLDEEVKLAGGGIVTRPTLAMIGEGSQPEAVIPLSRIGSLLSGEVKFKIEDDALVGILEQYENRRKNW